MKIFNLYNKLLTESQATSCISMFGRELFGQELGGGEINTPIENNYIEHIRDFTDNRFGEETTPEFLIAIKNLKKCMNQYPEILIPDNTTAYRGTVIPLSYFVDKRQPIEINGLNEYLYKSKSQLQSWSMNSRQAKDFGDNVMLSEMYKLFGIQDFNTPEQRKILLNELLKRDLRIGFILEYKTNPNEFMFKSKYFNKISHVDYEDEIIRFTDKPIMVKAIYNDKTGREIGPLKFISEFVDLINLAIFDR